MEVRQLRCVEAVERHRHFTRAAEELHLAQSALSHQIRRLERELGTPLFERTSRRVVPTDAGRLVAARARRVFAELDGAREEIGELRGGLRGRIRIGAMLPGGEVDIPGLLAGFSKAYPDVEVELREGTADDMFRRLAGDELDVSFCMLAAEIPSGLVVERLSADEVVAVYAPGRAPAAPYVTAADLGQHTLVGTRRGSAISYAFEQWCTEADQPLRLTLESDDPFLLLSLAARGFATAILSRSLTAMDGPAVDVRPLHSAVRLPVALVWRRERSLPPAARRFIELVRRETAVPDEPPPADQDD